MWKDLWHALTPEMEAEHLPPDALNTNTAIEALRKYKVIKLYRHASLIEAKPITGRTHQIRVHCQCAGHPIVGDAKYGDEAVN